MCHCSYPTHQISLCLTRLNDHDSQSFPLAHNALFAISDAVFFASFCALHATRSLFVRADYDAKRATAPGATISMQMSRRAANTKPAARVALLDRALAAIYVGKKETEGKKFIDDCRRIRKNLWLNLQ